MADEEFTDEDFLQGTPTPQPGEGTPTPDDEPVAVAEPVVEPVVEPAPKVVPDWVEKRFGELTKTGHDERRAKEALQAENENLKTRMAQLFGNQPKIEGGEPTPASAAAPALSPEAVDKLVNDRAAQLTAARELTDACNVVATKGAEEYSDFGDAIKTLNMAYPDQIGNPAFLQTLTKVPGAHKVYYELGKDPAKAEKILNLDPASMAIELTRMGMELEAPRVAAISGAPAPIRPVTGSARKDFDLEDPNTDIREWMRVREQQVADGYR